MLDFDVYCISNLFWYTGTMLTLYFYLQQAGKKEEEEFSTGPLSVLMMSVKNNTQVRTLSFFPAAIC